MFVLFIVVSAASRADDESAKVNAEVMSKLLLSDQSHIWDLVDAFGQRQRTLTLADAKTLLADPFRSVKELASMRPTPKRELASIGTSMKDIDGGAIYNTLTEYELLPDGLGYYTQDLPQTKDVTAGREAGIDVFGVALAIYWNSRFNENGSVVQNTSKPHKFKLVSGKLFSLKESFSIEEGDPSGGESTNLTCKLLRQSFPASDIHKDLTGDASTFDCAFSNLDDREQLIFLQDAERYVVLETSNDGKPVSRTTITSVTYRQNEKPIDAAQ